MTLVTAVSHSKLLRNLSAGSCRSSLGNFWSLDAVESALARLAVAGRTAVGDLRFRIAKNR